MLFVRDMGTEMPAGTAKALKVAAGSIPGQDFISAGRILEGAPEAGTSRFYARLAPETPVAPLVQSRHGDGWDFIKVYNNLSRAQYQEIAAATRQYGIRFGGHVPRGISVEDAAAAGQWTLEHARDIPNSCARAAGDTTSAPIIPRQQVILNFDPVRCRDVLAAMKSAGMGYVPTHVTRWFDVVASRPASLSDLRWRYVPLELAAPWKNDIAQTAARAEDVRALDAGYHALGLRVTRMAVDAGVEVMSGSDAGDSLQFPGFSLHDELLQLSMAGLTPLEVLRAATIVSARFLKIDRGSLAAGQEARLLFLDRNPLDDVRNTQSIAAVHDGRRLWDRAALDGLLEDVAGSASAQSR